MMLLSDSVGGADESRNGFSNRRPVNVTPRCAAIVISPPGKRLLFQLTHGRSRHVILRGVSIQPLKVREDDDSMPRRVDWRPHPGRVAHHRSRRADRQRPTGGDRRAPAAHRGGRQEGVQILGLQEIFNGPYFCPSQDPHWYDIAEPVPGPTTELMAAVREEVPDGDGRAGLRARAGRRLLQHRRRHRRRRHATSASTARTTSRTRRASGRSTSSSPATSATRCSRRATRRSASTSATTATSPRARALLGLNGAEIVFNPSATVAGLSQYLWKLEQPAHAVANGYFMALQQPRRHRGAVEHRQVLRLVATSSTRAASSSRRRRRTRTSSSSPRWTST